MSSRAFWAGLLCALCFSGTRLALAEDWLPVAAEDLHMTSEPGAPGAPAVYLYRQIDRDDRGFGESVYVRIKILTEAGRDHANVEIPFIQGAEKVTSVQARTIRPDGSVVNFDGTTYDRPIVKSGRIKYLAKTFTLPEVEVGSILEYRYQHTIPYGWVFDSHWVLSAELYTRLARFSLMPNPVFTLIWSWPRGLPPGTESPKLDHGRVRLEAHDIPAVVSEEYMPPDNEVRYRVDFIYDPQHMTRRDPVEFWKIHGQGLYRGVQQFCDKRSAMEKAVAQIVAPGDSPDTKLHKIYARVQQIHNLTFATAAEREVIQEKPGSVRNVEDVWKRGYGDAEQVAWLFLALTRAAGIDARPVVLATRDRYFFDPRVMNQTELNSQVVLVKLDGRDLYLDPAFPFTPFGLLPGQKTELEGLSLDKDGGAWVRIPETAAAQSRIERHATFKFNNGTLEGRVTVAYSGLEAAWRRLYQKSEDAAARKTFLEEDLQEAVIVGINTKLTNTPDWDSWEAPLVAEYEVEIPGWATPAGRRGLLPLGVFGAAEKHTFEHAARVHPISFDYLYQHVDDVTIEIPAPWSIDSVPNSSLADLKGLVFKEAVEYQQHSLHVTREITVNALLIDQKVYDSVRRFYQTARTADEQQAVVSQVAPGRN